LKRKVIKTTKALLLIDMMNPILLDVFNEFAKGMSFAIPQSEAITSGINFAFNPTILIIGVILIAVTIFILFFLKKVITNSILGAAIWVISIYFFHIELPLIPSFVISVIIGPAGIGTMLLLKFFGLMV
jgi:hypothetical protein